MTLVDSNVLLDVATYDPTWGRWSAAQLEAASLAGPLLINDVVYAEFSARYENVAEVDQFLVTARLDVAPMPRAALFLAAKAYGTYRRMGGTRTGVLSDFFIGAHAAVLDVPLLTRDVGHYRSYFPTVVLITP